ncbi:hypothetical protein [Actinomadura macrotermitis]|uniref:Uncharacterized protein n=1 Tax=Actinomadura macrotermitis TaxID=2585200 RepID=A0A7K0BNC0_9ACTN|nr:hypothetical protein [Actinomadura macrotermitis]MQY02671.1 hypothetical protein [Actinomadura macrotermitis]
MNPDCKARLDALGTVLRAHGLRAQLTDEGLRVENPGVAGCCQAHPSDVISAGPRAEDGGRLWFFTAWRFPVAEADRVTDAVMAIKALLNGDPGVKL